MGLIITGLGRLSKDPKMSFTANGTAQTILSVAVNTGWGDKAKTVWLSLASWGKQAELLNEKFTKGQRIFFSAEVNDLYTYKKDEDTTGGSIDAKLLSFNFVDSSKKEKSETPFDESDWEE